MLGAPIVVRKRPVGIAMLAVLSIAFGALVALMSLFEAVRTFVQGLDGLPPGTLESLPADLRAQGVLGALIGGAFVVAGAGLWALRPWAWWLAVVVSVAGLALSYPAVLWMAVWAAPLVYLLVVRSSFDALGARTRTVVS